MSMDLVEHKQKLNVKRILKQEVVKILDLLLNLVKLLEIFSIHPVVSLPIQ